VGPDRWLRGVRDVQLSLVCECGLSEAMMLMLLATLDKCLCQYPSGDRMHNVKLVTKSRKQPIQELKIAASLCTIHVENE
jgi:hypothetical protein